jgi:peptidoglycan/LPS O-acetylase OafA/YrhL
VGLDSLRALAAVSVCLFHFTGGMLSKLVVPSAKHFFSLGYLGVEVFFVISGFIIPYSLLGKNYRVSGILGYLKKRIVRINPPAYISLLIIIAQWVVVDKFIQHDSRHIDTLSAGRLLHNFLFTVPFTHYDWISIVFWTLAVEFQFYLFIGLLFNVLFNRSVGWFIALYGLTTAAVLLPFSQQLAFLHYSPFFALGGVALLWYQQRLSLAAYVASLLLFTALGFWQAGIYAALLGLGTAVAITAVNFRIPGLSFIGKISYSLYLFHAIIGTTAELLLVKLLPPTTDARKLFLTAVCFGLTIAGSYIFFLVAEQPFMRLASKKAG